MPSPQILRIHQEFGSPPSSKKINLPPGGWEINVPKCGKFPQPFIYHLNLTTTSPPPQKKRYLIKTSRNILCIGPGAQTSNFPNPTKSPRLSRLLGPDLLPSSMRSSPCAPNSFNHDLSDRGKHPDDVQALSFFLLWQKNMADLCWMILFPYKNDSQIFFKFRYCWYMSEFFLKITWGFWCKNAEKLQVFKTVARLRAGPKSLFWSKALFGTIPRPAEMQVLKRKLVWCLNFSTKLKTMRTVKLDRFPRPDGDRKSVV